MAAQGCDDISVMMSHLQWRCHHQMPGLPNTEVCGAHLSIVQLYSSEEKVVICTQNIVFYPFPRP